MNTILMILGWMTLMYLLIVICPTKKTREAARFFQKVLPKIPLTQMYGMWLDKKVKSPAKED
jgi:hypothetical protein